MKRLISGLLLVLSLNMGMAVVVPSQATTPPTLAQVIFGNVSRQTSITSRIDIQRQEAAAILRRLKQANKIPDQLVSSIGVQSSNTLNAYTDGKRIVVTSGMMQALQTDDQKAFVIGHELAHILADHVNKTRLRRTGLGVVDYLVRERMVSDNPALGAINSVGLGLIDKHFSRNIEYQADELGIQLMQQAQYNPQAAVEVLNILQRQSRGLTPEFLQSHPLSTSRIQALSRKYNIQQPRPVQ